MAKRQRIALAHIEAEREHGVTSEAAALSSSCLIDAHRSLYSRLSPEDRITEDGRMVEPGELRVHEVAEGRHQPPAWKFLYGVDAVLFTIAAAHHRIA